MVKYIKSSDDIDTFGDTNSIKIDDWYRTNYPTDAEMADELNSVSFAEVYEALKAGKDFYKVAGEMMDTVVRERLFQALATAYGVDYDTIYNMWLSSDEKGITASVHDDDLFVVCENCLAAIESREGHQAITRDIPESRLYEVEDDWEMYGICDWCEEEYPESELIQIL